MAVIPHVFKDAALTQPFDDATDTIDAFALNGASYDGVFYIGINDADGVRVIEASSSPGIDPLTLSMTDVSPGSGVDVAQVKLAASQTLLDSATAGAQISVGPSVLSGPSNAKAVWYRWTNSAGASVYTDLSFNFVARQERVV